MYIEKLSSGHYRYQMTFTEERTGRRRRVSCTLPKNTEKARREAQAILDEKVRRINSVVSSDDVTFGHIAERFLEARRGHWRASTYRRYTFSLKCLREALGADSRVSKLSARYVSERFAASGKTAATQNEMLRTFKTLMTWAYRNDYVESVEWLGKLEKVPEPSLKEKNAHKYLERDELQLLLPEMKIDLDRMIVSFLALSGLRIGECLALEKDDVDLAGRVIRVNKTMDLITRQVTSGAKTYASNREVFIQDELYDLCKEIRKYMTRMSLACGFRSDLFFSDFDGNPVRYDRLNKYFRENCERVLQRRLSLHSLRHTHASLLFEAGASLDAVSLRLGHSSSEITREIYLHITERKKEQYNAQLREVKILQ